MFLDKLLMMENRRNFLSSVYNDFYSYYHHRFSVIDQKKVGAVITLELLIVFNFEKDSFVAERGWFAILNMKNKHVVESFCWLAKMFAYEKMQSSYCVTLSSKKFIR